MEQNISHCLDQKAQKGVEGKPLVLSVLGTYGEMQGTGSRAVLQSRDVVSGASTACYQIQSLGNPCHLTLFPSNGGKVALQRWQVALDKGVRLTCVRCRQVNTEKSVPTFID